jgi:hypothetical protein
LQADAAVTAIIGEGDTCRHYPVRAPQGAALPYLVSQIIAGSAFTTHGQPADAEDTLDEKLVQFTAVAETDTAATALRAAVRACLLAPDNAVLTAAHIVVTSPQERDAAEDELGFYAPQLDLTFFHNPST